MNTVNKILIIGSAGSGKTTFSLKLGKIINLPIIHLDKEYWKPNWENPSHDEWVSKLKTLLKQDKWIIEGNYASTLDMRLKEADMIIFLDYDRYICTSSVLKRMYKNMGKQRPDLTEGCIETFDPEFLEWVWNFPEKYRPEILKILNQTDKKVVILKTRKEAKEYLDSIQINKHQ